MQKRCIIITAYIEGGIRAAYTPQENDTVLCADGGYTHARAANITVDLVIGDCDSGANIPETLLRRSPVEKDDTDTMLCIRYAIESGHRNLLIIGGIGGRLDHTIANMQALAFAHKQGVYAELCDANERVFLLENGSCLLPREEGRALSLFSYSACCEGVCEQGVQYPLKDATLTHAFPLGVSNKILETEALISVRSGILLVIVSRLR